MNRGDKVMIYNREKETHEIGKVVKTYVRSRIRRYDILLERDILLEGLTTDAHSNFFVDQEKSTKFYNQLNS